MESRLKIGHIIIIFAMVALPFVATFALYYPDERHYTDGAFHMLQHGDWLIPHTGSGAVRFEKPILPYWAVAGSWLIFGVNIFAARLPFLLICCGTLWLTYQMTNRFTASKHRALLAAMILAAEPQFFLCAIRNLPDGLLTFFLTLSTYGFLRILVWNEVKCGAYWMAYGGAAGAAMSKGLLGVGIVLFCWGFAFFPKRDWSSLKKLLDWPSMVAAFILVASWFIYIIATHGLTAWSSFFDDQVTGNIHGHLWDPILRLPVFGLIAMASFLPWSLIILEGILRRKNLGGGNLPIVFRKFTFVWVATLIIGFSLGTNLSLRYLLPASPLIAILLADWLSITSEANHLFTLRRVLWGMVIIVGLGTGGIVLLAYQWHAPLFIPVVVASLLLAGVLSLGLGALKYQALPLPEALGLLMLSGWLIVFCSYIPILPSNSAIQTADALKQIPGGAANPVLVINNDQLANRLRVKLGAKWSITQTDRIGPTLFAKYKCFVLPEKEAQLFASRGWQVTEVAIDPNFSDWYKLWRAFHERLLPEYLDGQGRRVYLVTIK